MHKLEIKRLFENYIDNSCSPEEFELFVQVLKNADEADAKAVLAELLVDADELLEADETYLTDMAGVREHLQGHLQPMQRAKPISFMRTYITIAATLIFVCAVGYYLFSLNNRTMTSSFIEQITPDKPPGRSQAMLMTAEGKCIILDDIQVGEVIQEGGVTIKKDEKGRLKYTFLDQKGSNRFNTISTPKGGRFEVVLADG